MDRPWSYTTARSTICTYDPIQLSTQAWPYTTAMVMVVMVAIYCDGDGGGGGGGDLL